VRENLKLHEVRLAKSVYLALKKNGVSENDLVNPNTVEGMVPDCLKGIGEKVSELLITNSNIKEALSKVNKYRNEVKYTDYDEKRKDVLGEIGRAKEEVKKALSTKDKSQAELALAYLCSFEVEVSGNYEKEGIVDVVVDYLNNNVLRGDVTVDRDLNLVNSNTEVVVDSAGRKTVINHDFDQVPGNWTPDDYANYRNYKNPERVRWLREREQKASDLIMSLTGNEFSSMVEINKKMNEGGPLSRYYTGDDGSVVAKESLEGIRDVLGLCVCEAIQDSRGANLTILGTLNTHRINGLLPRVMADDVYMDDEGNSVETRGLSDDVVINTVRNPFLREQLRSICLSDRSRSLLAMDGGWSSIDDKKDLIGSITRIVDKITSDKRMGVDKKYTSEARRIHKWLLQRVDIYNELMKKQIIIGHGEIFPGGEGEKGKEARLAVVRELLDYIEDSGSAVGSLDIMNECTKLFEISRADKVEQDIKDEIHTRLALAQTYHHMHAAGGLLDNRGQCVEDAIDQANKEGLIIDKKTLIFLLKNETTGFPTAESFDEIEKINFGHAYHDTLIKMMGMTVVGNTYSYEELKPGSVAGDFLLSVRDSGIDFLFEKSSVFKGRTFDQLKVIREKLKEDDSVYLRSWGGEKEGIRKKFLGLSGKVQNPQSFLWGQKTFYVDGGRVKMEPMYYNYAVDKHEGRKEMVKEFILQGISINRGEDYQNESIKKNYGRGWSLASKLIEATAESSLFNGIFDGKDDFGKLCQGENNTKDTAYKLNVTGPRIVTSKFATFFSSALRYYAGEGEYDRRSAFGPLSSKEVNVNKLDLPKSNLWFLYSVVLPKKIEPLHQFIRKEDISSKDFVNFEMWKKLSDCSLKVAHYGQDVLIGDDGLPLRILAKNRDKADGKVQSSRDIFEEDLAYEIPRLLVQGVLQMSKRPQLGITWGDVYNLGKIMRTKFTVEDKTDGTNEWRQIVSDDLWKSWFYENTFTDAMIAKISTQLVSQGYTDIGKPRDFGFKLP